MPRLGSGKREMKRVWDADQKRFKQGMKRTEKNLAELDGCLRGCLFAPFTILFGSKKKRKRRRRRR